jgi:hypothetical protein
MERNTGDYQTTHSSGPKSSGSVTQPNSHAGTKTATCEWSTWRPPAHESTRPAVKLQNLLSVQDGNTHLPLPRSAAPARKPG